MTENDYYNQDEIQEEVCQMCGGSVIITSDNLDTTSRCNTCGSEAEDNETIHECIEKIEDNVLSNVNACPFCKGGTTRLEIVRRAVLGYYVTCKCGVAGPYGKTQAEALDRWNESIGI